MATYTSHRLIMGKAEIDSFCCLIGDIYNLIFLFTDMFIESSTFHVSLNLIGCRGHTKGKFSNDIKKSSQKS